MRGLAQIGDVLAGKYRVDKILGIGGMGMVVAATHLEIDQRVALKFMLPSSESPESELRFLREARAAGRLNSEHVCRVSDVGRFDSGAPYIVMEYLQGENLGAILRKRGPFRVSEAVDYILQGIEGLAEAHAHGIIHRDLKPDNLFLHKRNDGGASVKVLDFGISKISVESMSTRTGDIMGSPAYMAPEQMESTRNVDHRADVWSLGVVLYQLVVGKAPFHGDTLPLLCMHVVNDEPTPMTEIRGDLPEGFEDVVMKCLRKEPVDRYADVGELAQALAPFGPKTASVSASRIQIVLRRQTSRDSTAAISTEFSTVPPEELEPARVPVMRMPTAPPREATDVQRHRRAVDLDGAGRADVDPGLPRGGGHRARRGRADPGRRVAQRQRPADPARGAGDRQAGRAARADRRADHRGSADPADGDAHGRAGRAGPPGGDQPGWRSGHRDRSGRQGHACRQAGQAQQAAARRCSPGDAPDGASPGLGRADRSEPRRGLRRRRQVVAHDARRKAVRAVR